MAKRKPDPQPYAKADQIPTRPNQVFSRLRQKWLVQTPEGLVRQTFLDVILTEYGFALAQIEEEVELTGRGSGHARADFVVWRTVQDRQDRARSAHEREGARNLARQIEADMEAYLLGTKGVPGVA
jgi:hypothetical protein